MSRTPLAIIIDCVGTAIAALGEAIMRMGHCVVRASYRLEGQEDLE